MRCLGSLIHRRFVRHTKKVQNHHTHFFRNVPMLEVIRDQMARHRVGATVRIASIGCSTGPELYSLLWLIRSARPDLKIVAHGVDISAGVLEVARRGAYRLGVAEGQIGCFPAGRAEIEAEDLRHAQNVLEPAPDGAYQVRQWLREGVTWRTGDALDPELAKAIGPQDLVIANNFLGPLDEDVAEACLRNLARLVVPGGILVVDGVDFELKTRVIPSLRLSPVTDRIEEIHAADPSKAGWPWTRWGHEPFDRRRADRDLRYAAIFRAPLT
jgi:chemotaxis methyl-accepting protein methylase